MLGRPEDERGLRSAGPGDQIWRVATYGDDSAVARHAISAQLSYGRLDQRQRPTVDYADEAIRADLARGQGLLDMR